MHLNDLKQKSPKDLLTEAEALGIEDASSMRKQDLMFAILKKVASDDNVIYGMLNLVDTDNRNAIFA